MTRFVFVCPPYRGHLNPMAALACGLVARGHDVTFLGYAEVGGIIGGFGLSLRPVGGASARSGTVARMTRRLAGTTGLFGIVGVIRDVARATEGLCREGPQALRDLRAEVVVADQTEAAGGLMARHLGLPLISVANALLINREPAVPPPFVDWRYDATEWGLKRNRGGHRVADLMMRPVRRVIERFAAEWRLPGLQTIEDCLSPTLQISQTIEAFDMPRLEAPPSLAHVGPLRGPDTGVFTPPDGRPLVFCSLGTLQGSRLDIFAVVAEACVNLGLSLVIAHGGKLDTDAVARLPGRPLVAAFVPQRAVIARAAAVVTHGGLNTVLDALMGGVPLVVVPIAFEQGAIAARVERCGAGLKLPLRRLTPRAMTEALRTLLVASRHREAAARLQSEGARAGGVARAVDLIEAATGPVPPYSVSS